MGAVYNKLRPLEQFQLLAWGFRFYFFLTVKKLYHSKLFVRYLHNTDLSLFGKVKFCPFNVYISIFPAGTKPEIDTELEHLESIVQQFFAEHGGGLSVLSGFGRQIKKYEYPHTTVLVESGKMVGFHQFNNERNIQNIG